MAARSSPASKAGSTPFGLAGALAACPLVAILRGLRPNEAEDVGEALVAAGLRVLEVPLNSPQPYDSIEILARKLAGRAIVGAGTVLTPNQARRVASVGGQLVVSPNTDLDVIGESLKLGLDSMPGIFTPTEAFAAIRAGARRLKLFPGEAGGPAHLKALRAVLPDEVDLFAVGGVSADTLADWSAAGAAGAGCGSSVYKPGWNAAQTGAAASALVAAARTAWGD